MGENLNVEEGMLLDRMNEIGFYIRIPFGRFWDEVWMRTMNGGFDRPLLEVSSEAVGYLGQSTPHRLPESGTGGDEGVEVLVVADRPGNERQRGHDTRDERAPQRLAPARRRDHHEREDGGDEYHLRTEVGAYARKHAAGDPPPPAMARFDGDKIDGDGRDREVNCPDVGVGVSGVPRDRRIHGIQGGSQQRGPPAFGQLHGRSEGH